MLRQSQNFWIAWVTTIVPAGFSDAVAQAGYKVTDLGTEGNDNVSCAMSLNNEGWTEIMAGSVEPRQLDFVPATLLNGRAAWRQIFLLRTGRGQLFSKPKTTAARRRPFF